MSTNYDINAAIYIEQGSTKMCFESGAVLEEKAGALFRAPVEKNSTLDKAMNCNGVSVVVHATSKVKYTLATPRAGVRKIIVNFTTRNCLIRGASAVGVRFGASGSTMYTLSWTGSTKTKQRGDYVHLMAYSSARWLVTNRTTTLCTLTTACT